MYEDVNFVKPFLKDSEGKWQRLEVGKEGMKSRCRGVGNMKGRRLGNIRRIKDSRVSRW